MVRRRSHRRMGRGIHAEGTAWEKARTKDEKLTCLKGSHLTVAVEKIQWLPQGVLLCVTEDLLSVSVGQTSWGKRLFVGSLKPIGQMGDLRGSSLGPEVCYHRAKQTHVFFEAVVLRTFRIILPNIRGVLQCLPSTPSQAVSVGSS